MTNVRFRGGSSQDVPQRLHPFKLVPPLCVLILSILFLCYLSPFGQMFGVYASGTIRLPGHVPALIKKSQLLGPTDPNLSLTLMVGLRQRNQTYLQSIVDTNARPYADSAGRHLSSAQFAQDYGPLPESQDTVIAYMQQAGFKVSKTYNHRLLVGFKGTIRLAEKTFQVQINNYRAPSGRHFYAPTTDPGVPASLASVIQSIIGLDTSEYFTQPPIFSPAHAHTGASPYTLTCPTPGSGFGFLPSQIATAYNLNGLYNAGFHGEGQSVALFELDNYVPTDISDYTSCYGGSSVPIFSVPVNGGPGASGAGAFEVESDMELVLSAAPQLASLRVYEAQNDLTDYMAEWAQIVSDDVPVVSTSWKSCEADLPSAIVTQENALFTTAAAQGQSILAAAGDLGSNACGYTTPTSPSVDDPASQPEITGVGGTTLTINSDSTYKSETTWNNGTSSAGGGGVSSLWPMPSWQQGPGVINATFSSGTPCSAGVGLYCREVPDVSLNADPNTGYVIYCTVSAAGCNSANPWLEGAGTSAAAPMWAAMIALANQKSVHDGNAVLGFLNPLLYQIDQNASGTSYATDFHDIKFGNNYTTGDGKNEYPATPNYDMTTGLGSYNALSLATDLEALAKLQNPPPTPSPSPTLSPSPSPSPNPNPGNAPVSKTWYFAEGKVGGGFTEYLTMENPDPTNDCSVNIQYLLDGGSSLTKPVTVPHASRFKESVNTDLNVAATASTYKTNSAIVTVNSFLSPNCAGIVAERSIYFTNFTGISSGYDVFGATQAAHTFYFADVPTGGGFASFITILNPGTAIANITAIYDVGGTIVNTQTLAVPGGTRGTIMPNNTGSLHHAAVIVTSDQPVVVERPDYYKNVKVGNAKTVSGASSVVGAHFLKNDWLFSEGYTGGKFQEYFVLANFGMTPIAANMILEFSNGHTETVAYTIAPLDQTIIDVNQVVANNLGTCDTTPCQPTQQVAAEISGNSNFIAEREMFFTYSNKTKNFKVTAMGGTDVIGLAGAFSAYSFAEGNTNKGYNELLALQNPTANAETMYVTLVNGNNLIYKTSGIQVPPHSCFLVDITSLVVLNMVHPGDGSQAYEVAMAVQSSTGPFVAERLIYWNTGSKGTQGGTDVIGYMGS